VGFKRNSKGRQESWIDYKLRLDVVNGDIPVSAVLSSARKQLMEARQRVFDHFTLETSSARHPAREGFGNRHYFSLTLSLAAGRRNNELVLLQWRNYSPDFLVKMFDH